MKVLLIPYIALGLVLSLALGIQYTCNGSEPTFYGSPFVFKQKSLGSSLTYYYSIFGLVLNILVWSVLILSINKGILYVQKISGPSPWVRKSYTVLVGFMLVFTTVNVVLDSIMLGPGFGKGLNDWHWDINQEAAENGTTCIGEWISFDK
jgi:hypothetical protein